MTYNQQTCTYTLSSGRTFEALFGVIGLDVIHQYPGEPDEPSYGRDGRIHTDDEDDPWTPEERVELAAAMIERWSKWATA